MKNFPGIKNNLNLQKTEENWYRADNRNVYLSQMIEIIDIRIIEELS